MGPNGSGKSVLSNVLSGKEDYKVTSGQIIFKNKNITELKPNEISNLGLFMAFQYPVEIPGVTLMNFLKTIHEANRRANGLEILGPSDFLKYVREKAEILGINDEVLKRQLNVGFSGRPVLLILVLFFLRGFRCPIIKALCAILRRFPIIFHFNYASNMICVV